MSALKVGSVWEFKAEGRTEIVRPSGDVVQVDPANGVVQHALNEPGTYVAGEQSATAK